MGRTFALFLVLALPSVAFGTGMGVFVSAGIGERSGSAFPDDHDSLYYGLILDTSVARARGFNYRLELGYGETDYGFDFEPNRYLIDQTFGFAVLRTRPVRLWLGPKIGLYYETDSGYDSYGINIGPAFGVNVHLGPVVTIALSADVRYGSFYFDIPGKDGTGSEWSAAGNLALILRFAGDRYSR